MGVRFPLPTPFIYIWQSIIGSTFDPDKVCDEKTGNINPDNYQIERVDFIIN